MKVRINRAVSFTVVLCMIVVFCSACATQTTDPTSFRTSVISESAAASSAEPSATAEQTDTAPTSSTPAPASTLSPASTSTPAPTPTPTSTPVTTPEPAVDELEKPAIPERFFRPDGTPEVIRFFVDSGSFSDDEWYDTLHVRSIALLPDGDDGIDADNIIHTEILKRNKAVEEELGVEIRIKEHGGAATAESALKPILLAGSDVYDVLSLCPYYDIGLAHGDTLVSLVNLSALPEVITSYIDMRHLSPWWSRTAVDAFEVPCPKPTPESKVNTYITGDLSLSLVADLPVSFVNKTMWDRLAASGEIGKLANSGGFSDVYEIVENGYWTLDLLMDLCELCYLPGADSLEGKPDGARDRVGVLTYSNEIPNWIDNLTTEYFSFGARVEYVHRDDQGIPVSDFNSAGNMEFFKKIAALMGSATCGILRSEDPDIMEVFSRGNALMTVETLSKGEKDCMRNMKDEYIVLPLPMLSHDQYDPASPSLGYAASVSDLSVFAVCCTAGANRIPAITATLELMGYYSAKSVTPAALDHYTGGAYGRDRTAKKMLDIARAGFYLDFGNAWSGALGVNCGGDQQAMVSLTQYLRKYYDNTENLEEIALRGQTSLENSLLKLLSKLVFSF